MEGDGTENTQHREDDPRSPVNSIYSDITIKSSSPIVVPNGYDADGSSGTDTPTPAGPLSETTADDDEDEIDCFVFENSPENANNYVIIREFPDVCKSAEDFSLRNRDVFENSPENVNNNVIREFPAISRSAAEISLRNRDVLENSPENVNNNVIREFPTVSRSAAEISLRNRDVSTQEQKNRQDRKGRISKSAGHSGTQSPAKLAQNGYGRGKCYHLKKTSKSCTVACDVLREDYEKPASFMDEDDSDPNIFYANFTSRSISISDFSQNTGSVSPRNFDIDDDYDNDDNDDYNETDSNNNDDDNSDDGNYEEEDNVSKTNDKNDTVKNNNGHAIDDLKYAAVNNENTKTNSVCSSIPDSPVIENGFGEEKLMENTSKPDAGEEKRQAENSENLLTTSHSFTADFMVDVESTREVNGDPPDENASKSKPTTFFNTLLTKTRRKEKNRSASDTSQEMGDNRGLGNELKNNTDLVDDKSAAISKIVELSLDGVTSEKAGDNKKKATTSTNTFSAHSGGHLDFRVKPTSHSGQGKTRNVANVVGSSATTENMGSPKTTIKVQEQWEKTPIIAQSSSPYHVHDNRVMISDTRTQGSISFGLERCSKIDDPFIDPLRDSSPGIKAPCHSMDHTPSWTPPNTSGNQNVGEEEEEEEEERRAPLPHELAFAIQQAVANGDFDGVSLVEPDGSSGYLLRYVSDLGQSQNEIAGQDWTCENPIRESIKVKSENLKPSNQDATGMRSSSPFTSRGDSQDGQVIGSKSAVNVLSLDQESNLNFKEKEETYNRREHNDVFHMGRKVDLMPDSVYACSRGRDSFQMNRLKYGLSHETEQTFDGERDFANKTIDVKTNEIKERCERDFRVSEQSQGVAEQDEDKIQSLDKNTGKGQGKIFEGIKNPIKTDSRTNLVKEEYERKTVLKKRNEKSIEIPSNTEKNLNDFEVNCMTGEHDNDVQKSRGSPFDWQRPGKPKIDCMSPVVNEEASGDFLADPGDGMRMTVDGYKCVRESDEAKCDTNGNKLVTGSESIAKEADQEILEKNNCPDHDSKTFSIADESATDSKEATVLTRKPIKSTTANQKVVKKGISVPNRRPRSKAKFLSLLLNMMDDDKVKKEPTQQQNVETTKTQKDPPDEGLQSTNEQEAESSEKTLSFPRGIDSIEPNDKTWWTCTKEDMELSNRQAKQARRRLMMRRNRLNKGRRKDGILGLQDSISPDLSMSPDNTSWDDCNTEGSDSCNMLSPMPAPTKELKKYIARMKVQKNNRMNMASNEDQMRAYAKAAESFVRPTIAESECGEDGGGWMTVSQTPFSQEGDLYSTLEDYYTRRCELLCGGSRQDLSNATQVENDLASNLSSNNEAAQMEKNINSARISKRRMCAPSIPASETLRKLSLDDNEATSNRFNYRNRVATWDYPRIDDYICGGFDSVVSVTQSTEGPEFYNVSWRSHQPIQTSEGAGAYPTNKGDVGMPPDSMQYQGENRSHYMELLQAKARENIKNMRKIDDEKISVTKSSGLTKVNREKKAENPFQRETAKFVRFSDVGVKTIKNNENQWNSTVNEMLLKSEKVMRGGVSENLNETTGPRYPRSQSAKKVSAVPEKTFNFLNELLEQDMQERKMSSIENLAISNDVKIMERIKNSPNSKHRAHEYPTSDKGKKPNLPPINPKSYPSVSQKSWSQLVSRPLYAQAPRSSPLNQSILKHRDRARSPVTACSNPPAIKSLSPRLGRRAISSLIGEQSRSQRRIMTNFNEKARESAGQSQPHEVRRRDDARQQRHTTRAKEEGGYLKMRRSAATPPENFQLGLYSDVFNYYVSPYLRDRQDTSIVQLYQK